MRVALVNPNWSFDGSIYFGCREPHLPLEFGYVRQILSAQGHDCDIVDSHQFGLSRQQMRAAVADLVPEIIVVTTAPSYLFWRCAPPELRVPRRTVNDLSGLAEVTIAIGPHGSATPRAALEKLSTDVVVMGEPEEILLQLVESARADWHCIPSICYREAGEIVVQGGPHAADFAALPALEWPLPTILAHSHHHHRFDATPSGPGAEIEASRGCPYRCTFCAKEKFRDKYRRRPIATILHELDRLIALGVEYVYFIDEIFLPNRPLLAALAERDIKFGIQTRIDLWPTPMLEMLGRAGCVSIEAGVESLSTAGRDLLNKDCRISTEELTERLIIAKRHVPFVQGNLIEAEGDGEEVIASWRAHLGAYGVWANEPVPLFPYPGSPEYRRRWGQPDDRAWERAHADYLTRFAGFSDIQDQRPVPLEELESGAGRAASE